MQEQWVSFELIVYLNALHIQKQQYNGKFKLHLLYNDCSTKFFLTKFTTRKAGSLSYDDVCLTLRPKAIFVNGLENIVNDIFPLCKVLSRSGNI